MMKAWRTWLAGWIMMAPLMALTGEIKLSPEAQLESTNGTLSAVVKIANLGDEAFKVTSIAAQLQGRETQILPEKSLVPGEVTVARLLFPAMTVRPDERPAVIRIRYVHDNGHVFSSLALARFADDHSEADPWISIGCLPASIGRTGKLSIQLLLMQDDPSEVSMHLILPDELSCESVNRNVMLEPDIQRVESFELKNQSAVPGGTYSVFVLVERAMTGSIQCASSSGGVKVVETKWIGQSYGFWGGLSILLLLALWFLGYMQRHELVPDPVSGRFFDAAILTVLSVFIIWFLSPFDLIRNTTPVGGDTPAHLYLVSHLKEQLLHHGRIISWAGGWWCGFPMFQYYFALPYSVAALLSVLIPLNVAFKLVSVAGLVLTPCSAYWAAREWRLPGFGPIVMALAMVPFLFVHAHTMWGVNTASTLAGMIANSWSFALMLPALALGSRDISAGVIRGRTILLFVLVLASHFFTSVIMFVTLAIVPLLNWISGTEEDGRRVSLFRGLVVLGIESAIAVMMMGWWVIPLILKSEFSMDFGVNWELTLIRSFPEYSIGVVIFAGVALVAGIKRFQPMIWLLVWLGVASVVLFKVGYSVSPVFVNVRLWPFVFFAMMALGAVGGGVLLNRIKGGRLVLWLLIPAVLFAVVLSESLGGFYGPGLTRSWAKWNFSGLEAKSSSAVFTKWMPLLKDSPGRLANDLCEENNQLGSSRVFELVPYLIGKPILEGGLVNSALGSMYSYYVQGETSPSCAGFPPIVVPTTFDFARATRHLELFNVKQFIARSSMARQALASMKEWRLIAREEEWALYELMTHEGRYVFVPPRLPYVVETSRWKECSLEWLYTPQALDQFLLWEMPGMKIDRTELVRVDERRVLKALADLRQTNSPSFLLEGKPLSVAGTACISDESVTDDRIRFKTTALGLPHIIKMTWFPNWKVRGAKQVYCVSPGFMCVFPDQPEVELYYGTTWSDVVGYVITIIGWCSFAAALLWFRNKKVFFTRSRSPLGMGQ